MAVKNNEKEYLRNFGKNYNLFMTVHKGDETFDIIVYSGSLRSILKYTTFAFYKQNNVSFSSIDNFEDLRKCIVRNTSVFINDDCKIIDMYMSATKDGKNKRDLPYCPQRDILYATSDDICYFSNNFIINNKEISDEEKIQFIKFILNLEDKNYTNIIISRKFDMLTPAMYRVEAYISDYNLKDKETKTFEQYLLEHFDCIMPVLYNLCKDYDKKKQLLEKVYEVSNLKSKKILSNDQVSYASYLLTKKLKESHESRKFIENSIKEQLIKSGVAQDYKTLAEKKKAEQTPEPVKDINYEKEAYLQMMAEKQLEEETSLEDFDDDDYDDFLGPKKANEKRYREIN